MKNAPKSGLTFLVTFLCIALSPPVVSHGLIVPDTGQNFCYDWNSIMCDEYHDEEGYYEVCDSDPCPSEGEDFYGQDASYTINPPDLTDNGDGTVTDNLTNLMWEQKNEENDFLLYTYQEASTYCENLPLAGHEDWRVPTRKEYVNLLNLGRLSPSLDTDYFPFYILTSITDYYYWTSTDYHPDPVQVWVMQLAFGIIGVKSKEETLKIRCVRGASEPAASYTDNGNGTVTDNVTDLMWEQKTDDNGPRDKDVTHTWLEALNYCEDLDLANYYDWRLPNPKEMERMIDTSTSGPAADTAYFPNTINGIYWTSSSCVGCHKFKAFAYDFEDGELSFGVKFRNGDYRENSTRCVRTADSSGTTTTTTATNGTICPTEEIYGTASPQTQLLRGFRDTILSRTPEGQELIKLYYSWSPFLVEAMRNDEDLKVHLKETVDKILQLIDSRE